MSGPAVLEAVARQARERSDDTAIACGAASANGANGAVSWRALDEAKASLAAWLARSGARRAALLADNGPAWLIADLGALAAGLPLVPVPHFFSPAQTAHLLRHAGCDLLLVDDALLDPARRMLAGIGERVLEEREADVRPAAGLRALFLARDESASPLPEGCAKITYTSGSTGEPKGVCLSQQAMETVAASLIEATGASADDVHLSLLPYATLLENIGGAQAAFMAGARVIAPSLSSLGLSGASGLDARRFVTALAESGATTCIMIPQMLHALVAGVEAGLPKPASLRYVAVGGAPVSEALLARAAALGLPVFEGYGLSEAASVVAVNRPGANRPGTVGRPLPHVALRFAEDGEILVKGSLFLGYLGQREGAPSLRDGFWPTGDVGELDADGFLRLRGRKKHMFITSFGRNVSPEWVERELAIEPAVAQCCVFGEARPFNVAVIAPRDGMDEAAVRAAVEAANARLPDYARISRWIIAREPFTVANGQWTGTGRPRRQAILRAYREEIEKLYQEEA